MTDCSDGTVEMMQAVSGCRISEEWHVHYVAGHNAGNCQSLLIRKTGSDLCLLIQSQTW